MAPSWHSAPKKVAECSQRLNLVADDLSNRQHWNGEDRTRNTPQPKPEDERDDDKDWIECEPSGHKHRRDGLALDQMNSQVKSRRKQRLPKHVMGQQTSEKED